MDYEKFKNAGIEAAYKGAEVTRSLIGKLEHIRKKGEIDLLTEADLGAEKAIIRVIQHHFPDHAILAEESRPLQGTSRYQWVIDPVDGTTNYAHAIEHYAISIALTLDAKVVLGIVLNPETDELFTAVTGKGAFLNNQPITASKTESVSDSLLATGFPYNFKDIYDAVMVRFSNCLLAAQGIRRFGSAALDLCYVACGRFDGYWEQNLNPWDTAAGFLMVEEAGGSVTDFSNQPYWIDKKEILATNGKIHPQMLPLLKLQDVK